MTHEPTTPDAPLAHRIALLMRYGSAGAAALLSAGGLLSLLGVTPASTALLAAGCTLLVLLPAARLLIMMAHFRRAAPAFALIAGSVLALVVATGAVGYLTG